MIDGLLHVVHQKGASLDISPSPVIAVSKVNLGYPVCTVGGLLQLVQ